MCYLKDFEKITYVINKIKKTYTDKILKEAKKHKNVLNILTKFIKELNSLKEELKIIRSSTEIDLINYYGNNNHYLYYLPMYI